MLAKIYTLKSLAKLLNAVGNLASRRDGFVVGDLSIHSSFLCYQSCLLIDIGHIAVVDYRAVAWFMLCTPSVEV